jgi:hypothetical protein
MLIRAYIVAQMLALFRLIGFYNVKQRGHAVAQWLRHCATNRKVAGSIPDGVILPVALWQNEYHEGKGDRCAGLTTLPPSCAEIWEPQPPGTL